VTASGRSAVTRTTALLLGAALGVTLIGCATASSSSPVEETPVAAPPSSAASSHSSPTPEVVTAAIAILANPGLTMRTVVSGTANLDPTVGFRVSGAFDVDGADLHVDGRGYGYDVKWYSPLPQTLSDRESFESFLRTLELLH
jgi:hypothetical protein